MEPPIDIIRELIAIVEEAGLAELTIESGPYSVTIRTTPPSSSARLTSHSLAGTSVAVSGAPASGDGREESDRRIHIRSPMIGVFYRAPAPGAPAFVEVGSVVEVGQTVGIIEAMKVFNEIPSEVHGRVVDIPAKNEQLVQTGDTLVVIDRLEH